MILLSNSSIAVDTKSDIKIVENFFENKKIKMKKFYI